METIKEFCATNTISAISNIRENTNGLLYCTFVNKAGKAENIYFSRRATERVTLGDTPKVIKEMFITSATNAQGETRLKIAIGGEYTNVADLF
jgi:hypothetical protein